MERHVIRSFRELTGKSLTQAAAELAISKATLSRIETGTQEAQPELMRRIHQWSGGQITPNDILGLVSATTHRHQRSRNGGR